ncbi:M50 family metallopeptidase [Demequina aurantiaca]|uniref:M50 family metallopeptidase n=1 Tax=Demequina aurantiaca TaxID=676200 RepID=UPI0007819CD4|nr:site-2 protease family protein [Demequina aurantiaca]
MAQVVGILVLVLGLLISIGLHEMGHMIPAKKFGVRVSQYFVGFGPTLWSRHGKETEYGIKAIPLGGYVKLVGMIPPEESVKPLKVKGRIAEMIGDSRAASTEEVLPGEDYRAFYHLAWWKKVIVMAGGPLVNLFLALLLFTTVLVGFGSPTPTLTVNETVPCIPAAGALECEAGDPQSPAAAAGLEPGDQITAIDGLAVTEWPELTEYVAANPGKTMPLDVVRDGEDLTLTVTPTERERAVTDADGVVVTNASGDVETETVGYLGVAPEVVNQPQGIGAGAALTWDYLGKTFNVVFHLPQNLYHVTLAALGQEDRDTQSVIGVVGVGRIAGDVASADVEGYGLSEKIADMLMLLGGLNLALFVFNMIPLVPLDGGHIASAIWQAIKNGWAKARALPKPRPVDVARMMPLAYGVFGLLLVMGLVLIVADIVAPVSVT